MTMKKQIITALGLLISLGAVAQVPEDVLKYSWQPHGGTARIQAVGGAMGSLGGDISSTFINPAGLAFYKTSDFVLSPGYSFLKNKGSFRGTDAKEKDNFFNLGASGIVGGLQGGRKWTNKAISLAVTRSANFSNRIFYTGQNDFSSFGEQYAAEAAYSGLSLNNDEIFKSPNVSMATKMALWNYLADTATLPGNSLPDFVSTAMYDHLKNGNAFLVNQSHLIETSGGITEAALGFAANMDDKIYIGGSLGIPIVRYNKRSVLLEEDATGDTENYFDFAEMRENFSTKGVGFNLKAGVIIKPAEFVRLGLAIHSPTWYSLQDSYDATLTSYLENYYETNPGVIRSVTSQEISNLFSGGAASVYKYELITPWKFLVSGSYVLREIADVRSQKGFITADIEYVTHKSSRFRNAEDYDDGGYYDGLNEVVKDYYKNALNFRIGGELKFTTLMTRLGFAYYGNPYADSELKANRMFLSGGIGYRHAGMYIDLTYVHGLQKDISFPYRLPDKANTFATTRSTGSNLLLTLGFKI